MVAAARPIPPVHEKTSGEKVPCSTSRIRWSYARFLMFSVPRGARPYIKRTKTGRGGTIIIRLYSTVVDLCSSTKVAAKPYKIGRQTWREELPVTIGPRHRLRLELFCQLCVALSQSGYGAELLPPRRRGSER